MALLEAAYEEDALKTITEDPFRPLYEIYGFGYKGTLKLAEAVHIPQDDLRRLEAMIYEMCRQMAMNSGNTYIPYPILQDRFRNVRPEAFEEALTNLIIHEHLQSEKEKIFPFSLYEDEIVIAQHLNDHVFEVETVDPEEIDEKISEVEF
ncbi:MAG TPA: hypothetical protein DCP49_07565, partial [Erysipelotrichaceae bacterium]|nr:hypothetical protein [Erysipelotrichaceae bacterium]